MNGKLNLHDFGRVGSDFKTTAVSVAGSKKFKLDCVGDFALGDEVIVIGSNPEIIMDRLFERKDSSPVNRRTWIHNQPLCERALLRGYDGTQGEFLSYIIDIAPEEPGVFRWTKDYGATWQENIPLTEGWIALGDGVEIKINDFPERAWGATAVFCCSSRLVTRVEAVDGNLLTLADAAKISSECEIMHSDSLVLQNAVNAAIEQQTSLFLPNGKYRLVRSIEIKEPSGLVVEGESAEGVILDKSLEEIGVETYHGATFNIIGGSELTLRNLTMIGGTGFAERESANNLMCHGGTSVFGFYFHKSNATCIQRTKRVLVDNCHARKMSAECFYSMGVPREKADPEDEYTREITFYRCSVEDSARNAFNNNDKSEGTSILYCRVKDVGNCMNEGSSRFLKIHGCYVSNCGWIATGNVRARGHLDGLGAAQHIITNNYFEGHSVRPHEPMIKLGSYTTQVTIANNIFVNFASPAIEVFGSAHPTDTPPENVIITGNSIDLTAVGEESRKRFGIRITSGFVTASDNHIFVRGTEPDDKVTGIEISDDATRVNIHDNTIALCGAGIASERVYGRVGKVVGEGEFYRGEVKLRYGHCKPMLPRRASDRYRGWIIHWLADGRSSEILDFDPETLLFTLKEKRVLNEDDEFFLEPSARTLPWLIHNNLINDCATPLALDTEMGSRAAVKDNYYN